MRFPPAMISLSYGYIHFFSLSTENRGLLCKWRAHVSTAKWVKWFSSPKCCRIRSCICKKFHRAQLGIPSYICIARAVDQHNLFLPGRKRETTGFCFIVPADVLRTWTAPQGIAISLEYITFDYRRSSADAQTMGFVTQNSAECGIEPPATIFPRGATENKIKKRRRRRRGLNGTRQTFTTVVFRVMGEYIVKKIHNNNKSAPPAAPDFLKDSFVWVWNRGEKNKRNDYII